MGLSHTVVDAYRCLVETYEADDELFLFGSSRGAFTARGLAGLVRNSGIPRDGDRIHRGVGHGRRPGYPGSGIGVARIGGELVQPPLGVPQHRAERLGRSGLPAKERFDRDTAYRPPELERCLTGQGRVRLEPALLPGLSAGLPPLPPAPPGPEEPADAHKGIHHAM